MSQHSRPNRPLTPLQARFVEQYIIDLNATAAAARAGSRAKDRSVGFRMLQKPHVQVAIAARQAKLQAKTECDQVRVIRGLLAEAEFMGKGTSHAARVSAWAHLGKHLGMFADIVKFEELKQLTDTELDERIHAKLAETRVAGATH